MCPGLWREKRLHIRQRSSVIYIDISRIVMSYVYCYGLCQNAGSADPDGGLTKRESSIEFILLLNVLT